MNISGIRPGAGFYDYNYIQLAKERSAQIQDAQVNEQALLPNGSDLPHADSSTMPEESARANTGADNGKSEFAKFYEPDATYELKGANSDIRTLDMEQAISDMQKDQVLQQYQFFVGEQKMASQGDAMGVRAIENFTLD